MAVTDDHPERAHGTSGHVQVKVGQKLDHARFFPTRGTGGVLVKEIPPTCELHLVKLTHESEMSASSIQVPLEISGVHFIAIEVLQRAEPSTHGRSNKQ